MITQDNEIKAPRTRRDEESICSGIDPNRSGGSGQDSSKYGDKSVATCGNDRKRKNTISAERGISAGKIIEHLISKSLSQAEELEEGARQFREQASLLSELLKTIEEDNQ